MRGTVRTAAIILGAILIAASPVAALAKAAVSAALSVEKIVLVTKDGVTQSELSPDQRRVPGDLLRYRMDVSNGGPDAANEVVINYPMPPEVRYEGESGADTLVSVDGGKTFALLGTLTIAAANGATRPAVASDVTHLRWPLGTIAAKTKKSVSFRATLK